MDKSRQKSKPKLNQGEKIEYRPSPNSWEVQRRRRSERGRRSKLDSSNQLPNEVETITAQTRVGTVNLREEKNKRPKHYTERMGPLEPKIQNHLLNSVHACGK